MQPVKHPINDNYCLNITTTIFLYKLGWNPQTDYQPIARHTKNANTNMDISTLMNQVGFAKAIKSSIGRKQLLQLRDHFDKLHTFLQKVTINTTLFVFQEICNKSENCCRSQPFLANTFSLSVHIKFLNAFQKNTECSNKPHKLSP